MRFPKIFQKRQRKNKHIPDAYQQIVETAGKAQIKKLIDKGMSFQIVH